MVGALEPVRAVTAESVGRLLCPDPDHQPPCPVPWNVELQALDDEDPDVADLRRQVEIESSGR